MYVDTHTHLFTDAFDEDALILIGGETVGVGHSAGTFNFPRTTLSAYLRLWMMPVLAQLDPATRPRFFGAHCVGAIKMALKRPWKNVLRGMWPVLNPQPYRSKASTLLAGCALRRAFTV